jgi:hypothetical protein
MRNQYTAVIKQDGKFWIGWIKEIPGINCQEFSKQELLETLRITLSEAIEINENEALLSVGENYSEELIVL